jgi:hypothetical protein
VRLRRQSNYCLSIRMCLILAFALTPQVWWSQVPIRVRNDSQPASDQRHVCNFGRDSQQGYAAAYLNIMGLDISAKIYKLFVHDRGPAGRSSPFRQCNYRSRYMFLYATFMICVPIASHPCNFHDRCTMCLICSLAFLSIHDSEDPSTKLDDLPLL